MTALHRAVLAVLLAPAAAWRPGLLRTVTHQAEGRHNQVTLSFAAPGPPGQSRAENADECLIDEPQLECTVRRQVDGPWADVWARYVLLRPGMSYSELKQATFQRNQLDPSKRIPGTYRTVVLAHAFCFAAAIPTLVTNDEVFPKLLAAAAASRVAAGL